MRVPKGLIYALLGPSGCGKTTLLSCVVGLKKIQTGKMFVLGHDITKKNVSMARNIGYMPQENSLYTFFTIREIFQYFGMIHGLSNEEIDEKFKFYTNLLDLPSANQFIRSLSGGEYRRISLAVTLLHKPEILILDEPTVGVDTLLRKTIWDYLKYLTTSENISIIITTHYIEEARQADTVGLMRYGSLLTEASPKDLLLAYDCNTLEEVFLKLCSEQNYIMDKRDDTKSNNNEIIITRRLESKHQIKREAPFWGKFKAALMKNYYSHRRNALSLGIIFFVPIFQTVLFFLCVGVPAKNLNLAVVNDEVPELYSNNTCPIYKGCLFKSLSCRLLDNLDPIKFRQVPYANLDAGKNAVKAGKAWSVIYFRSNFSSALFKRLLAPEMSSDDVFELSEISIWGDNSVSENAIEIELKLRSGTKQFLDDLMIACKRNPKIADLPMNVDSLWTDIDSSSRQVFMLPAMIMSVVFLLSVMPISGSIICERNEGLMQRSVIAEFLQGICGVALGVFLSQLCEKEFTTTLVAMGIGYPVLCVSGIMWPLEGIPIPFRQVCQCLPLTYGILALQGVIAKGWGIAQPEVLVGLASLGSWIAFFLITAWICSYFKRR
ncbi:ABC transporter G family member 23-like [Chrysoperla carnea]|uniref:ABC transporter G family member 23-like n=1 Tax=Chrysoperla carnea TaxID=189513 RepID=UPI001D080FB1|nr:ABC transporter G family member 23-like [Chrysoperla carnea]